ncbi:zinc-binding dehydrogenase [Bradyrhizobium sp. UFLA05-153]
MNPLEGDLVEAVRELKGGGVQYSFEMLGLTETGEETFNCSHIAGTATIVGAMMPPEATLSLRGYDFLAESRSSLMRSNRFRTDVPIINLSTIGSAPRSDYLR